MCTRQTERHLRMYQQPARSHYRRNDVVECTNDLHPCFGRRYQLIERVGGSPSMLRKRGGWRAVDEDGGAWFFINWTLQRSFVVIKTFEAS